MRQIFLVSMAIPVLGLAGCVSDSGDQGGLARSESGNEQVVDDCEVVGKGVYYGNLDRRSVFLDKNQRWAPNTHVPVAYTGRRGVILKSEYAPQASVEMCKALIAKCGDASPDHIDTFCLMVDDAGKLAGYEFVE